MKNRSQVGLETGDQSDRLENPLSIVPTAGFSQILGDLAAVEAQIRITGVICVDLDGTLSRSDAFADALFLNASGSVKGAIGTLSLLRQPRPEAKARLAALSLVDPAVAPYDQELIDWLRGWRSQGIRTVLATAANRFVAQGVAEHLDLFDEVIASTKDVNLKGTAKQEALVACFGARGFVYVGDSRADLTVWEQAAAAVALHARPAVLTSLADGDVPWVSFDSIATKSEAWLLFKAMRPHQWSKNMLVFVPLMTAGDFFTPATWLAALATFIAFSACASAVYLINDAADLMSDRHHPRKRDRPFASGKLSIGYVLAAAPLMLGGAFVAWTSGTLNLIIFYILLTTYYSFTGKQKVILDVMILSLLYSVRLFAGGLATEHFVSSWLLAFSGFLFFNLALMKRYAELSSVPEGQLSGRGYVKGDLPFLLNAGIASGFSACVVMALYVEDSQSNALFGAPLVLWALAPLMLGLQLRLWRETVQGRMTDDPIIFAARDRVTHVVALAALTCLIIAHSNLF